MKRAAPATKARIDLGRKLFMDRRLPPNNTMSCAMCHVPEQGFAANEISAAIGITGRSLRRNVALTGPYMHDGSLATLEDVIEFYQRGGIDNPLKDRLLQPLQLTLDDKRNLAAFLRSLNGDNLATLARQARSEPIN